MENKMAEVAKLLGLELGEEFTIKGVNSSYRFKLTAIGLMSSWKNSSKWNSSGLLEEFITGHYQISIDKTHSVLDDVEKRYLRNIIKPFKKQVKYIRKCRKLSGPKEYISIAYVDSTGDNVLNFPDFKANKMYQGMKIDKLYKLEELGL